MLTITTAEANLDALFDAKAAARGKAVRRPAAWADDHTGRKRWIAKVRRRGFHVIPRGGQQVVICKRGFLEVVC